VSIGKNDVFLRCGTKKRFMRSFAIIFLSPALFLILFAVTKFSENAVAANIMNDKDNVTFLIARVMEAYGGKQNIGNVKTLSSLFCKFSSGHYSQRFS
jgi:hypothetical protein